MTAEVMSSYPVYNQGNAWTTSFDRRLTSPTPSEEPAYRTTSPIVGVKETKKLIRPKSNSAGLRPVTSVNMRARSVPPSLRQNSARHNTGRQRPKTAAVFNQYECGRVNQVEHESTRKHNLESHLPVRKIRSPPWQKNLDVIQEAYRPTQNTPIPVMVTPGYTLSKSKTKIEMHIKTDEFFEPPPEKPMLMRREDPERDSLISQLQQQIDDLTLFLEEERLNHRETKRRAADHLKDRVDEMTRQHENYLRQLQSQHEEDQESLKQQYEDLLNKNQDQSNNHIAKMKKEIEYLQGAFESYKSNLHFETDERWTKKEDDLRNKYEEDFKLRIAKLRQQLYSEKSAEKAQWEREHKNLLSNLKREHKKEQDTLIRRYANHHEDLEKLKIAEQELQTTQEDLASLQENYDRVCSQLTDVTRDLSDTKVKLFGFQENFQGKVQEIDDKYKEQIHELKQSNIELRRLYVKKCGELFDEKSISDQAIQGQAETAKETMKYIIETRNRALVSVAAGDPYLEKKFGRQQKNRPMSAPGTKTESVTARISAGETYEYTKEAEERRPKTAKPRIFHQIQQEIEDGTLIVEESHLPEDVQDLLMGAV